MARDESGSATLSEGEREAGKRAGRKQLGRDGCPEDRSAGEMRDAANRTKITVKDSLKLGSQETRRAMDGD